MIRRPPRPTLFPYTPLFRSFVVGMPILASLAISGFAYRHRRDPLLFLMTLLAGGALFLTIPYVGYMDNITCLFILGMTLPLDRKSTRLNSSHLVISYAVFCL